MNKIHEFFLIAIVFIFILTTCSPEISKEEIKSPQIIQTKEEIPQTVEQNDSVENFLLGIDVLKKNNFDLLENKRVGLITNQTGVDKRLKSTVDILFNAENVQLVALFGPEHGVRGDAEAGKYIQSYVDEKTNLPVYSLYGRTRKPTSEMLKDIDVLVYDIQDVGVRSYTFISTMGLAMEAASENDIEFVILDRPNPLGGIKVEGNILEDSFKSFISQYPIPYVYGLTCGELAQLLVNEKMILTKNDFKLEVVRMEGWKRKMIFSDTKLNWVPTSPHIPNSETAMFYPMTGILGELRNAISIGVGYTLPFQIIGAEWIDEIKLSDNLNKIHIPGLHFRPISFSPFYGFGTGKTLHGVQIYIENYDKVNLVNCQFYIINILQKLYPNKNLFKLSSKNEISMFNKAIGTDKISDMFENREHFQNVLKYLNKDIEKFRLESKKYYLY